MELKKPAVAGTMESSDIMVMLRPNEGRGMEIDIQSDVKAPWLRWWTRVHSIS